MPHVGYLIIHGTSQDIMSTDETTVHLARYLAERGSNVIQIGGPGSAERAILSAQEGKEADTPIDEMHPGFDYGMKLLTGGAFGTGIDGIMEEGVAALKLLIERGATSVNIIGFSRGGVAGTMICHQLRNDVAMHRVSVTVALLDPVPGPVLVPKTVVIPPWVRRVVLLTSRNEGRPGFNYLNIEFGGKDTALQADTFCGVHGDIGGSTRSPVTTLVRDALVRKLGVTGLRKSDEELEAAQMKAWLNPRKYTSPGWMQSLSPRDYGWPKPVTDEEANKEIEFASSDSTSTFLGRNPAVSLAMNNNSDGLRSVLGQRPLHLGEETFIGRLLRHQARSPAPTTVKMPIPPTIHEGRVVYPPPVTRRVLLNPKVVQVVAPLVLKKIIRRR